MESNFNNKDFEQFVKQNADQYRMFPSEKVWNGIHNTLHARRRWYGIGLTLLLLTTGIVTWVMLLSPTGKNHSIATTSVSTKKISSQKNTISEAPIIIIATAKSSESIATTNRQNNLPNNLFLAVPPLSLQENKDIVLTTPILNETKSLSYELIAHPETILTQAPVYIKEKEVLNNNSTTPVITESMPLLSIQNSNTYNEPDKQKEEIQNSLIENTTVEKKDIYPLSIESVVNSYQKITRKKRVSFQIFFLPTISYRKLTENKSFLLNTQQISAGSSPLNYVVANDINNVVTHKPDIGLELGFNAGYPISRKLKLTTGLQLNISKYDIKAYPYPAEQTRMALSNNNGSASISIIQTNYRNFETSTDADWLSNFYISASLPVGLEMKVTNTQKPTYLGIGGTIQPTYILGDRAYLISTDFKNYAKVPSLTREWNVSTSFEVFAGYTTGKIKWKVGPQVRYQLLSSFEKKYPVKEHLMDFGLKVGVMLK